MRLKNQKEKKKSRIMVRRGNGIFLPPKGCWLYFNCMLKYMQTLWRGALHELFQPYSNGCILNYYISRSGHIYTPHTLCRPAAHAGSTGGGTCVYPRQQDLAGILGTQRFFYAAAFNPGLCRSPGSDYFCRYRPRGHRCRCRVWCLHVAALSALCPATHLWCHRAGDHHSVMVTQLSPGSLWLRERLYTLAVGGDLRHRHPVLCGSHQEDGDPGGLSTGFRGKSL